MMIDFRLSALLFLAATACGPAPKDNTASATREIRVRVAATYDPEILESSVGLTITSEESFPVCFSSNDLGLTEGSTFVRNLNGAILNGHGAGALEELRGINVASPIEVLRPGKDHPEFVDLEEFSPNRQSLYLQVQLHAFRCSDLFDDSVQEVRQTLIEKTFRIANNRIVEQPGLRFPDAELPRFE